MLCPSCGTEVGEALRLCPSCEAARVVHSQGNEASGELRERVDIQELEQILRPPARANRLGRFCICLGAILAGIYIFWFLFPDRGLEFAACVTCGFAGLSWSIVGPLALGSEPYSLSSYVTRLLGLLLALAAFGFYYTKFGLPIQYPPR